jgi:hypothetical protein
VFTLLQLTLNIGFIDTEGYIDFDGVNNAVGETVLGFKVGFLVEDEVGTKESQESIILKKICYK